MATIHERRGESERALISANQGLALRDPDQEAHLLLVRAQALAALGRGQEAREGLASALALASEDEPWRDEATTLARQLGLGEISREVEEAGPVD